MGQPGVVGVFQHEHEIEQCTARRQPQVFHQIRQRDVLQGQHLTHSGGLLMQLLAERLVAVERRGDQHGIGEHTDCVFEFAQRTVGYRAGDAWPFTAGQGVNAPGINAEQHLITRDALSAAKPIQCSTARGSQRLTIKQCLRARLANRQQRGRRRRVLTVQPGQGATLIAVTRVDTPLPLPQGKLQRAQTRRRLGTRQPLQRIVVQLHQVIEQQVHRPAINGHVMQVKQQAAAAIGKRQQPGLAQRRRRQIERRVEDQGCKAAPGLFTERPFSKGLAHRVPLVNLLMQPVGSGDERRAQPAVPSQQALHGVGQCVQLHARCQVQDDWHVVSRRLRRALLHQPQATLLGSRRRTP